jgi:hypothetical protein
VRQPRRFAIVLLAAVALTLPWLWLWPRWAAYLVGAIGFPLGPQAPIPYWLRIAAALGMLATRRRLLAAVAAALAVPAFYYGSFVLLVAPLGLWLRELSAGPVAEDYFRERGRKADLGGTVDA